MSFKWIKKQRVESAWTFLENRKNKSNEFISPFLLCSWMWLADNTQSPIQPIQRGNRLRLIWGVWWHDKKDSRIVGGGCIWFYPLLLNLDILCYSRCNLFVFRVFSLLPHYTLLTGGVCVCIDIDKTTLWMEVGR